MDFWMRWNKEKSNNEKNESSGWIGIGIGVVLLVLGAYHDQFTDIYRKAVMICMECIGIG